MCFRWRDESSGILVHIAGVCLLFSFFHRYAISTLLMWKAERSGIMQGCYTMWQLFPNLCTTLVWSFTCDKQDSLIQRCYNTGTMVWMCVFPCEYEEPVLWIDPSVAIFDMLYQFDMLHQMWYDRIFFI